MTALKVTAALVTAVADNGRVVYLYKGDAVPSGITKDSLDNLKSLGFVAADEAADEVDGDDEDQEPAGNASREEWAAYAESKGLTVPDDAKREDIKALVAESSS